jgi:hypothetical protein
MPFSPILKVNTVRACDLASYFAYILAIYLAIPGESKWQLLAVQKQCFESCLSLFSIEVHQVARSSNNVYPSVAIIDGMAV